MLKQLSRGLRDFLLYKILRVKGVVYIIQKLRPKEMYSLLQLSIEKSNIA